MKARHEQGVVAQVSGFGRLASNAAARPDILGRFRDGSRLILRAGLASGRGEKFNAFTEMRHALYAANPETFAGMLTNVARDSFDAWLAEDGNEQA
ncbi:MAG: (P)ppGpp synthetase [Bradyrhizobium sp.]|nr:(P)ppGpp synthetase [Bradyrhizobium sp.]